MGLGLLAALLSGCVGKPLDKEATRVAMCSGAQKIDLAFWAIAQASPGLIPGHAMDAEGAFVGTLGLKAGNPDPASSGSVCAKIYTGDVDVAINTAVLATVNVSRLIQARSK